MPNYENKRKNKNWISDFFPCCFCNFLRTSGVIRHEDDECWRGSLTFSDAIFLHLPVSGRTLSPTERISIDKSNRKRREVPYGSVGVARGQDGYIAKYS